MGKKLQKYLDEAEKTEQQIAELEERLRPIRAAQKKEEDSELIRAIRSTKKGGRDLLALLAKEQPQIKLLSAAGEQVLEKKEAENAARKLPERSKDAQHSLTVLKKAKEYLEAKPEIAEELSAAERRKRAQLKS